MVDHMVPIAKRAELTVRPGELDSYELAPRVELFPTALSLASCKLKRNREINTGVTLMRVVGQHENTSMRWPECAWSGDSRFSERGDVTRSTVHSKYLMNAYKLMRLVRHVSLSHSLNAEKM